LNVEVLWRRITVSVIVRPCTELLDILSVDQLNGTFNHTYNFRVDEYLIGTKHLAGVRKGKLKEYNQDTKTHELLVLAYVVMVAITVIMVNLSSTSNYWN